MKKKTGIMFAFNEAPKKGFESYLVESVNSMRECVKYRCLDEVFILNDGSTDNTEQVVLDLIGNQDNIYLISSKNNLGKLKIFSYGLNIINELSPFQDEDLIFTFDSDMKDFLPSYVEEMEQRMEEGEQDMVVATFFNGVQKLNPWNRKYSGIRVMKSHLINLFYDFQEEHAEFFRSFLDYQKPQQGYCLEEVLNLISCTKGILYSEINLNLHVREGGKGNYNIVQIEEGFSFYNKFFSENREHINFLKGRFFPFSICK